MNLCLEGNNQQIITFVWVLYDWQIEMNIFKNTFQEEMSIIESWYEEIQKLDYSIQKKKFEMLFFNVSRYTKISYLDFIIKINLFEKFGYNNDSICCYTRLDINTLVYLIKALKYDFMNLNTSIKNMFSIINYFQYNKIIENDMDELYKYFDIILKTHNMIIPKEIPDNTIEHNDVSQNMYGDIICIKNKRKNYSNYEIIYDIHEDLQDTGIILAILKSNNVKLFQIALTYGLIDVNIEKWYRNIIVHSCVEIFKIYFEHKPLSSVIMKTILNSTVVNITDTERFNQRKKFILYFVETFDSDIFVINSNNYKFIINCLKHPTLIDKENNCEYYKIFKIKSFQILQDGMTKQFTNIIINIWKIFIMTLQLKILILSRHFDPSKYYNKSKIIYQTMTYCDIIIIEKITKFISYRANL